MEVTSETNFSTLVKSCARIELHVHLRGAMRKECWAALCEGQSPLAVAQAMPQKFQSLFSAVPALSTFLNSPELDSEALEKIYRFTNLREFLLSYVASGFFVNTAERFQLLVRDVIEQFERQDFVYVEVTVSLGDYLDQGIPLSDLLRVLEDEATRSSCMVKWILDPVRNRGGAYAYSLVTDILKSKPKSFSGMTLGGMEDSAPIDEFSKVYELAREADWGLTLHCGETGPAESILYATRLLGLSRIGHGIRALDNPEVVAELRQEGTVLEMCPIGNLRCGLLSAHSEHPIFDGLNQGLQICLNTDDPTFFNTTLEGEFEALIKEINRRGGDPTAICKDLVSTAVAASFTSEGEKSEIRERLQS